MSTWSIITDLPKDESFLSDSSDCEAEDTFPMIGSTPTISCMRYRSLISYELLTTCTRCYPTDISAPRFPFPEPTIQLPASDSLVVAVANDGNTIRNRQYQGWPGGLVATEPNNARPFFPSYSLFHPDLPVNYEERTQEIHDSSLIHTQDSWTTISEIPKILTALVADIYRNHEDDN